MLNGQDSYTYFGDFLHGLPAPRARDIDELPPNHWIPAFWPNASCRSTCVC
jgi:hypothetical protein